MYLMWGKQEIHIISSCKAFWFQQIGGKKWR